MTKRETRTQTIIRITRLYAKNRVGWLKTFTLNLIEQYAATTNECDRRIHFKDLNNSKKFVQRCIENKGDMRFPAELEEAWILSLPEDYRYRLLSELNDRYGMLTVYKHELPIMQDVAIEDYARLMKETSDALTVLSKIMHSDGQVDYRDYPFLNDVKHELTEVASAALTIEQAVVARVMGSMVTQGGASLARH